MVEITKTKQELPPAYGRDARLITNYQRMFERTLSDLLKSDTGVSRSFLVREIDIVGGYDNEKITPDAEAYHTVFVGTWRRHPETGLFVRFDLYDIVLNQDGKWYVIARGLARDTDPSYEFRLNRDSGRISIPELQRASALAGEFTTVINEHKKTSRRTRSATRRMIYPLR